VHGESSPKSVAVAPPLRSVDRRRARLPRGDPVGAQHELLNRNPSIARNLGDEGVRLQGCELRSDDSISVGVKLLIPMDDFRNWLLTVETTPNLFSPPRRLEDHGERVLVRGGQPLERTFSVAQPRERSFDDVGLCAVASMLSWKIIEGVSQSSRSSH